MTCLRWATGALLVLLLAAGCAGSKGGNPKDEQEQGTPRLELVGPDSRTLTFGETHELAVRYLDPKGEGIAEGEVNFTLDGSPRGSSLAQQTVTTDSGGSAAVTLEAGRQPTSFQVAVSAEGAEGLTVPFDVVAPEDEALEYTVHYDGDRPVDDVEVALYNMADCSMLQGDSAPEPDGIQRPWLDQRREFSVQPERGYALVALGITNAGRVTTDICKSVEFEEAPHHEELNMTDYGSDRASEYEVDEVFDMAGALPDSLVGILDLAEGLSTDPGEYLVDFVLGLADVPDEIETFLEFSGSLFASFVNDAVEEIDPPDLVTELGDLGTNLRQALREVTFRGQMSFGEQDEFGNAEGDHALSQLVVHTGSGPATRMMSQQSAFEFTEQSSEVELEIDEHAFDVSLQTVIDMVYEQTLLDEDSASLRSVVDEMLNCSEVADEASDSTTRELARRSCDFAAEQLLEVLQGMNEDLAQYDTLIFSESAEFREEAEGTSHAKWTSSESDRMIEFDGTLTGAAPLEGWPTHPVHEAIAEAEGGLD